MILDPLLFFFVWGQGLCRPVVTIGCIVVCKMNIPQHFFLCPEFTLYALMRVMGFCCLHCSVSQLQRPYTWLVPNADFAPVHLFTTPIVVPPGSQHEDLE